MSSITIDPLTRIEGHLKIKTEVDDKNKVVRAEASGQMFRGVEVLLQGRDPMDAHHITQRICGVCPISHATASCIAQENAYEYYDKNKKKMVQGVQPTKNGRLLQNLVLGANYIQSHILHFYHLAALDYVDVTAILKYNGKDNDLNALKDWATEELDKNSTSALAPFWPCSEGNYIADTDLNIHALQSYLRALDMRTLAHEMLAIFGGKMPHVTAFIPTGVTANAQIQRILRFQSRLEQLIDFVDNVYVPDVVAVAKGFPEYFKIGKGPDNFLCYGVFREEEGECFIRPGVVVNWSPNVPKFDHERITEDVKYSYYKSPSGLRPSEGETEPDPRKRGAYSWLKAPRYDGKVMQVGPLSRMVVQYLLAEQAPASEMAKTIGKTIKDTVRSLGLEITDLNSVMGRHAARALECQYVAKRMMKWIEQLDPEGASSQDFEIPEKGRGFGGTEAPRGALGHWLTIENYRIKSYQCVVPTTWNCSPRDEKDNPGAVEQALQGTTVANREHPIELGRIVRSFDPCIACSVH